MSDRPSPVLSCGALPPRFERDLRDGSECPLAADGHEEHLTVTPDGRTWRWNGTACAYPDACSYDGNAECCVSFRQVTPPSG